MVTHLKTTIEIADSLLGEAKEYAAKHGTTLRALVEAGLRQLLAEGRKRKQFRLRDASFAGKGLRPELRDAGWDRIRDVLYDDRGG